MRESNCSVAVVGGGVAACATALKLARRGVEGVALIRAAAPNNMRVGESIPPDSRVLLQELGIWDRFVEQEHQPCLGNCSSWGSTEVGYSDFVLNPYGNGWHLDRARFEAMLAEAVSSAGVRCFSDHRVVGCVRQGGLFDLKCLAPDRWVRELRASYVVDASGTGASVAGFLGAKHLFLDRLVLVYGFFETSAEWAERHRFTMLEAVPDGWWYLAALPERRVAVAFATDSELLRARGFHLPANWRAALLRTRHVVRQLDGCCLASEEIILRPAPSFVLDRAGGEGWLAAGDAGSAHDPLSAQGIFKALSEGIEAGNAIADAGAQQMSGWKEEEYDARIQQRFETYSANRAYFYGLEQRWPDSAFWSRRQRSKSTKSIVKAK